MGCKVILNYAYLIKISSFLVLTILIKIKSISLLNYSGILTIIKYLIFMNEILIFTFK